MKLNRVLFVVAILLSGCGGDSGGDAPEQPAPLLYSITYNVTGSASKAAVTYQTSGGGTVQETVSLPWSKSQFTSPGKFLYVSAQNQGALGTVTTSISYNGQFLNSSTSSGGYVIATAQATCC